MADYTDLRSPKTNNPAGTKLVMFFCPLDDFDTIGTVAVAPATLDEEVQISTDHTFAAGNGKGFRKIELEVNKNDLQSEFMGAVMGGMQKMTFTGFHTGLSASAIAQLEKAAREKHIILVATRDGQYIQLGEEDNGAMIKSNFGLGADEGGERGFPITVEYYGYIRLYTGLITLAAENQV